MEIRHNELEIDEANPFDSCKLDRKKFADILTDIVGSYPAGFVLAINNEWGTGKTTFVRMWQQSLKNKDYKTVYFNAWENDFDLNPLVALMAELKTLTDTSTAKLFRGVAEKGAALTKAVLPAVVKAATKRYFDTDEVISAVEGVAKSAADTFDEEIKAYKKKKESIVGFRDKLESFIKKAGSDKPIVFIIDELDRCRPNYAVEVLEQIKHFFTVPGITFVLSIDKNHLAASIRGFYGSEQINTDEYLRRFIDLEYSIPKPSIEQFTKYLYEFYGFDEFFKSSGRLPRAAFRSDGENFLKMAASLFDGSSSTLRQVEKIFGQTRLILSSFQSNQYALPEALLVLVFWSVKNPEFYARLKVGKVDFEEIGKEYSSVISKDPHNRNFFQLSIEARLLVLLENEKGSRRNSLLVQAQPGVFTTKFKSVFENDGSNDLALAISNVYDNWDAQDAKLSYLTQKIDLTEPLVFD